MPRNDEDRKNLRDWGEQYVVRYVHPSEHMKCELILLQISGREYLKLEETEIVGADNAVDYRTGGEKKGDICGVVVDKKSGAGGKTEILGTPAINTGPEEEAGYSFLPIAPGQDCWTWGSAAVLYVRYK